MKTGHSSNSQNKYLIPTSSVQESDCTLFIRILITFCFKSIKIILSDYGPLNCPLLLISNPHNCSLTNIIIMKHSQQLVDIHGPCWCQEFQLTDHLVNRKRIIMETNCCGVHNPNITVSCLLYLDLLRYP